MVDRRFSHHEYLTWSSSTVLTHHIDASWEDWETRLCLAMKSSGHNCWGDYWDRQGGQYLQGFYDDGDITRVGGTHCGVPEVWIPYYGDPCKS
jgi:hypothetical protein